MDHAEKCQIIMPGNVRSTKVWCELVTTNEYSTRDFDINFCIFDKGVDDILKAKQKHLFWKNPHKIVIISMSCVIVIIIIAIHVTRQSTNCCHFISI